MVINFAVGPDKSLASEPQHCHLKNGDEKAYTTVIKRCRLREPTPPFFLSFFFFKILFIFRERGREGERGRETSVRGGLSHPTQWGPGLQPRHVPRLGPIHSQSEAQPLSHTSQGPPLVSLQFIWTCSRLIHLVVILTTLVT